LELFAQRTAHAVVADGDDCRANTALMNQRQLIDTAKHGKAVDAAALQFRVVIEKRNRVVGAGLADDVEHDPAMSASTEDDEIHPHRSERPVSTGRLTPLKYRIDFRAC
jgi:hypothetical protein